MPAPKLKTKILRKQSRPEEYRVYRAALEWNLIDPIVIEGREDLKSEKRWKDQIEPFHHQVKNLITFCRRLPVTLLADDVGLGKTISAGLIASELIARARLSKILIVCPKMLGPQWKEELETKFGISAEVVSGKKLISADPKDVGAIITTYQSARQYLEKVPKDRFQMLVLDEAHKLRNLYGVEKPPKVATIFRKLLEERRFRYVLMLTATPIQNRLWDLYSLVDLLTVARGHENPFGSSGLFARKFIDGDREAARHLKLEAQEEFRSIVYGYMSRVRRGDANLSFPAREVLLERVLPTFDELRLIDVVAKYIQSLNRLAQISILFALTSSPQALLAQLLNMDRNKTIPPGFASEVSAIVQAMPKSAKLIGLGKLIQQLQEESKDWRCVVFTGRRETQTTIQIFLEEIGLKVGIINGESGLRNQETIGKFKKENPDFRVIVSTEAGSEGLNLQVANVLINYDLPWNPMIVEQRIGRVQRLASVHEKVSILNITLQGTFEDYIVARLMEKLQMASHAIGDIESLLEASGLAEDEPGSAKGFDEKIRLLVLAALQKKDIEFAAQQAMESIEKAKEELAREEENIDAMLGSMDGNGYVGPRAPKLPPVQRSMSHHDLTIEGFKSLGATITSRDDGTYIAEVDGGREIIRFDDGDQSTGAYYSPGSPAFLHLVSKLVASGVHDIEDGDGAPLRDIKELVRDWLDSFGGQSTGVEILKSARAFDGDALMQVRTTVAHDSYERLVEVACDRSHHVSTATGSSILLPNLIQNPLIAGINPDRLAEAALEDAAVSEFRRFYLERREAEVAAAGDDMRKREKLHEEFTPRTELSLVGLRGRVRRETEIAITYRVENLGSYRSLVTVIPAEGILRGPSRSVCEDTGKEFPEDCIGRCELSGFAALRHRLVRSELSGRLAHRDYALRCEVSNRRVLADEVEISAISEKSVSRDLLRTSQLSGRRAEAEFISKCAFTGIDILKDEAGVSEISGRVYRLDQQRRSSSSRKAGHTSEFFECEETGNILQPSEGERCAVSNRFVRIGLLETCAHTGQRVISAELERCAVSGKKVLKHLLIASNVSGAKMLEEVAVRSAYGNFCSPQETRFCAWSGHRFHPDDLRVCTLTGVPVHFEFTTTEPNPKLGPLNALLNGVKRSSDHSIVWPDIASKASETLGARCQVESAFLAPDQRQLAVVCEVRSLFGWRVSHAGMVYSLDENNLVGRVVLGKREQSGWVGPQ